MSVRSHCPDDWQDDWLAPDWPAPPGVRAVFTTRACPPGTAPSAGGWGGFNLGDHVGDRPEAVAAHRAALHRVLGARPVFLRQVHGWHVAALEPDTPDGVEADAAFTTCRRVACTVMVADCLPVLLADAQGRAVAAAHAGWRGLAGDPAGQGVLEQLVQHFWGLRQKERSNSAINIEANVEANEIVAWLGPCIGPQAFEVGPEVRAAFVAPDAGAAACFTPVGGGKFLGNLPALARRRLAALGIRQVFGNDGSARWCTVTQAGRFHSYRRDQRALGASGRMAACVWLD